MARKPECFVILADMRTGSNALEEKLNAYEGIVSHGELFNPHFMGKPNCTELFGTTLKARDQNPLDLIDRMRGATKDLSGFRLFSDHDARVLDHCLRNRKCAKIVLTRNIVESYVSLKTARATGQWWVGDMPKAKSGKATFHPDEFSAYTAERTAYLDRIRRALQETGQTAFYIDQRDLNDEDVIAGAARFLGAGDRRKDAKLRGKVQHPVPLSERVTNYLDMKTALAARDPFDLEALPEFEPSRGPNVPGYLICRTAPLLYMPVKCAADARVRRWMAAVDGGEDKLITGQTQKQLRQWKRKQGRHASFTVVSHPVARAHRAFCQFILPKEPPAFLGIRDVLIRNYDLVLPDEESEFDNDAHAAAFLGFLRFLKGNLGGQTSIRVDSAWASQVAVVQGIAGFAAPEAILHEAELPEELGHLARRIGINAPDLDPPDDAPVLAEIYSDDIEAAARAAYQRDYMMFGFGAWRSG